MLWFCRMQSTVTAQCLGLNLSQPIQFIKEETQTQRGAFAQGCSLAYAGSMPSLPHTLPFTALPPGRATGLLHSSEPPLPTEDLAGVQADLQTSVVLSSVKAPGPQHTVSAAGYGRV